MPEPKNENLFRSFYGTNTFIEKTDIDKTKYQFKSKSGNGNGYPDFFNDNAIKDWVIIVECKATDHEKAQQEVCYYMSNEGIKDKYNRIGIATSGENDNELKVSYYYALKGNSKIQDLIVENSNFITIEELEEKIKNELLNTNKEKVMKYKDKLNTYFDNEYFNKIEETKRPLVFSAFLLVKNDIEEFLKTQLTRKVEFCGGGDTKFFDSLNDNDKIKEFNHYFYDKFIKKVEINAKGNKYKTKAIEQFAFLKELSPVSVDGYNNYKIKDKLAHTRHDTRWSIYEEFLKDFCNQFEFFEDLQRQFDIISQFYIEFLSYGYKQAGGNVILTPEHIKNFMCKIAGVNQNSVILDTCTGTGGFLIKAMQIMFNELEKNKQFTNENKEKVKNNLIGVENLQSLFCSAFVNMMLNGDGKTNLVYGDCLTDIDGEFEKMIRNRKPDIGIINPPYNDNQAIVHIERLLDLLCNKATGCIIAPANTLMKNPQRAQEILKKHSLRKYVLMPSNLFVEQAGAQQTAIFIFEAHTPHKEDDLTYFYNLSNDGYKYSSRKMYDLQGVAENVYKQAIHNINNTIEISNPTGNNREAYKEKINLETMKNAIFTTKIQNELKMSDFAKTIIDYYIYEIEEQKRKLCSEK